MKAVYERSIGIIAPPQKVWHVLTDRVSIKTWMLDAETELIYNGEAGSPIRISGKLHDVPFNNKGTVLRFEPNKVFEYDFWSSLTGTADTSENYSVITFDLHETGGGTLLKVTQTNFVSEFMYKHWEFYWNSVLHVLKKMSEE
jgi:uncharacterized protein YndB with AHSA1/START domain